MRAILTPQLDAFRVKHGELASRTKDGFNGCFRIPTPSGRRLVVIVSDGGQWDHVSVSVDGYPESTPTWEEMDFIRMAFFAPNEVVVQYHPPTNVKVNFHPGCLHLWRPHGEPLPMPPTWMVGPVE